MGQTRLMFLAVNCGNIPQKHLGDEVAQNDLARWKEQHGRGEG